MNLKDYIALILDSTPAEIERIHFEVKLKTVKNPKTKDVRIEVVTANDYAPSGIVRFTVMRKAK